MNDLLELGFSAMRDPTIIENHKRHGIDEQLECFALEQLDLAIELNWIEGQKDFSAECAYECLQVVECLKNYWD